MEESAKQFYIHRSFINVYYYTYKALEDWIASNVFRNDPSRVFLASNEYAFRRRFELTSMNTGQSFQNLELGSLRFPFANYWPLNTGWTPDDRPAALNAAMIYKGIYEGTTNVKAVASAINIPVTFYFDREDDARIAYDILYFKSFNLHHYEQSMPYGEDTLTIPIELEIQDLRFNPEFTEKDWLQNNRIFTITATVAMRSFDIAPPSQPDIRLSLDSNGYLSDGSIYNDGRDVYYLTQEVILKQFEDGYGDLATSEVHVDGTASESIIPINKLYPEVINSTTIKLTWGYGAECPPIDKITINLENESEYRNVSADSSFYLIQNLEPNSNYRGYIRFYSKNSSPKVLGFAMSTPADISQVENKNTPEDSLVGISW